MNDKHPEPIIATTKKRKIIFSAQTETQKDFTEQLMASATKLDEQAHARLLKLRKDSQDKVYAKLQQSNKDFLIILLKERSEKIPKELPSLQEKLQGRQKIIIKDLRQQNITIQSNVKSIEEIRKELEDNLHILRTKNPEKSISDLEEKQQNRKQSLKQQNYLEFRRENYWKQPNQKRKSVLQFLKNINSSQQKLREKYQSLHQLSQRKQQQALQRAIRESQQKHIKERQAIHDRYKQQKKERQKEIEHQVNKRKEAENFLAKYQGKTPAHIIFAEKEKQQSFLEEDRLNQALKEYKSKRRGFSHSEIVQSLREYQQYKEMHALQIQQQRMMELQEEKRIRSRLESLYKSRMRIYSAVKEQSPSKKQMDQQKLMKMMLYSQKVKESCKPRLDPEKREEMIQSIVAQKKKDNKIIKVRGGEVILLDKNGFNPRQIGLRYLEQVKQMTSSIQRKEPAPAQPIGMKIMDRSLQAKPVIQRKFTISNWKQILDDEKLSNAEKERRLQQYFELVEQEQAKLVVNKKGSSACRSIELQERTDHYELEKAAAKLALLKSLS